MKASRGFFCLLELHQRKYMPHFFRCGLNLTAELFNLCNAADQVKCLDIYYSELLRYPASPSKDEMAKLANAKIELIIAMQEELKEFH